MTEQEVIKIAKCIKARVECNCPLEDAIKFVKYVCPDCEIGYNGSLAANEYQRLAARTINKDLTQKAQTEHALFGLCAEVGELHGIYQKHYQGHEVDLEHIKKELGDICWMIAEYCTVNGIKLSEVMQTNIDKLKARYPDGFEEERSLHRVDGDI